MTSFVGAVTGIALLVVAGFSLLLACVWPGPALAGLVGGFVVGLPAWWVWDGARKDRLLRKQQASGPKFLAYQGPIEREPAATPPSSLDDPTWLD